MLPASRIPLAPNVSSPTHTPVYQGAITRLLLLVADSERNRHLASIYSSSFTLWNTQGVKHQPTPKPMYSICTRTDVVSTLFSINVRLPSSLDPNGA